MAKKLVDYSIILAAGKGTRFYSSLPKVLHKFSGLSLLSRAVMAVAPLTLKEIIVVAGFGIEKVREEVEFLKLKLPESNIRIAYQEEQLGTGHATKVAVDEINGQNAKVLIIPGDCPLLETSSLESFVQNACEKKLSVLSICPDNPFGFGRIIRSKEGLVKAIVEEKDASEEERKVREINTSIFCIDFELLKFYLPKISKGNKQGEYYLTDIVSLAVADDVEVGAIVSEKIDAFLGANSRRELFMIQQKKRLEDLYALMEGGVTIEVAGNNFH